MTLELICVYFTHFIDHYWCILMYDHFPAEPLHHRVTSQLEAEGRRHQFSNCSSESVLSLGCSESHYVVSLVCFIASSLQQKHPKSLSHRESERMSPVSFFSQLFNCAFLHLPVCIYRKRNKAMSTNYTKTVSKAIVQAEESQKYLSCLKV